MPVHPLAFGLLSNEHAPRGDFKVAERRKGNLHTAAVAGGDMMHNVVRWLHGSSSFDVLSPTDSTETAG